MSNSQQVRVLRKGARAWNLWLHKVLDAAPSNIWPEGFEIDLAGADLTKLDLSGAHLYTANLKGANFSGSDLTDAHLSAADLSGAIFRQTKLERVKFFESRLSGADFRNTRVSDCGFGDTDLTGAEWSESQIEALTFGGAKLGKVHFKKSYLGAVQFDHCLLDGADFAESQMDNCAFLDVDLSNVKGLQSVEHIGPSTVGIDTFYRSDGQISRRFLARAGVPQEFIKQISIFTKRKSAAFYSCFISYSHKDQTFCDKLYLELSRRGIRVWCFPHSARPGKVVWEEIDSNIKAYDKVIVACSKSSLTSAPVLREIERALGREDSEKKEILFPIQIDDYLFEEWEHARKSDLTRKVVGDFRKWRNSVEFKKSTRILTANLEANSRA